MGFNKGLVTLEPDEIVCENCEQPIEEIIGFCQNCEYKEETTKNKQL